MSRPLPQPYIQGCLMRKRFCFVPVSSWARYTEEEVCIKCREANNGQGRRIEVDSGIYPELGLQPRGQPEPSNVDKPHVQRQALGELELCDLLRKAQTESYQRDRLRERGRRRIGATVNIMNRLGLLLGESHEENLCVLLIRIGHGTL